MILYTCRYVLQGLCDSAADALQAAARVSTLAIKEESMEIQFFTSQIVAWNGSCSIQAGYVVYVYSCD